MDRQLRAGNVAEAVFRLWFEEHVGDDAGVALIQQGYNPEGIIPVGDKRERLMKQSDPDFALVAREAPDPQLAARLLGISINSQKRPYDRLSTMGGYCIKCPRAMSCYDGNEKNAWYNEYNIINDYPQFRERFGGVEVLLITLFFNQDSIFKWVQKEGLDDLLLSYIYKGRPGIEAQPRAAELLSILGHSHRGTRKRKCEIRWFRHTDVLEGKVTSFVTGGLSQFGRPRMVYCIDLRCAGDETFLLEFLSKVRRASQGETAR